MKHILLTLVLTTSAFADDLYRKMEIKDATKECGAMDLSEMDLSKIEQIVVYYIPEKKLVRVSYAMDAKTSEEDRQAIRDRVQAEFLKACGKGYDVFETTQKGEYLTTGKDRREELKK